MLAKMLQSSAPYGPSSTQKQGVIDDFDEHVSPHKGRFHQNNGMSFVMGRREGPRLYDLDDGPDAEGLYNLHCNGGVFNVGHRHPRMVKALRDALDEVDIGNHHLISPARAALGKRLAELTGLKWSIFNVSGGEAIDLALKLAYGHTGRPTIVSVVGGYHGTTGLSIRAGDEKFLAPFNLERGNFVQVPHGDVAALAAAMGPDVAAVILETVPATLGMVVPPDGYLPEVRRLCDSHGALFILDEVQTGVGRSGGGKMWAYEHYDVRPDILVLGKGLSGGVYPMSATCFREDLAHLFKTDPFSHISTFGGSEIGCRVTLELLEMTSAAPFLAHIDELAKEWRKAVDELRSRHPDLIVGIRQLGLFMGIEMSDVCCGPLLTKTAFDQGILMIYAGNDQRVIQLLPPFTMPLSDIPLIIEKLDKAYVAARKLLPVYRTKKAVEKLLPIKAKSRFPQSGQEPPSLAGGVRLLFACISLALTLKVDALLGLNGASKAVCTILFFQLVNKVLTKFSFLAIGSAARC